MLKSVQSDMQLNRVHCSTLSLHLAEYNNKPERVEFKFEATVQLLSSGDIRRLKEMSTYILCSL